MASTIKLYLTVKRLVPSYSLLAYIALPFGPFLSNQQKEEMDSATVLLKTDMEAIAKERVDHAETVNRLTLSLKVAFHLLISTLSVESVSCPLLVFVHAGSMLLAVLFCPAIRQLFSFVTQESQRQVQDLLDQSRGAELSKLKIQLQQCTASKELTEQLCTSLQVAPSICLW